MGFVEILGRFVGKCVTAQSAPLLIKLQKHCMLFKGLYLPLKGQGPEQTYFCVQSKQINTWSLAVGFLLFS